MVGTIIEKLPNEGGGSTNILSGLDDPTAEQGTNGTIYLKCKQSKGGYVFLILQPNSFVNLSYRYSGSNTYFRIENYSTEVNYVCIATMKSGGSYYISPCIFGTELNFRFGRSNYDYPSTTDTSMNQMASYQFGNDPIYFARSGYG